MILASVSPNNWVDFLDASYIEITDAIEYPEVNGVWKKIGQNGGKPAFKHISGLPMFLYADTKSNGNWQISDQLDGGNTVYWTHKTVNLTRNQLFYLANSDPIEESPLKINLLTAPPRGKRMKLKLGRFI